MANRWILQIALLLSFSTTSLSLSYNLLQLQQYSSSLACQELLRQLKGKSGYCLKDRMDFKFPEDLEQPQRLQKENAAVVIQEMLLNILDILRKNFSNAQWNEAIVEKLLVELHRQIERLKTMLQGKEEENVTWEDTTTTARLKGYYWRLRRYLTAKANSSCAWTVVRVELSRNFSIIRRLAGCFQE